MLRFDVDVVPSYLTLPDVDVNLVLLLVLWDVCHGDVLAVGCLCLKLSWPGAAFQPRPLKAKASTLVLENSQCCPIFRLYDSPCSCSCVGPYGWQFSLVGCVIGPDIGDGCLDPVVRVYDCLHGIAVNGPCLLCGPACGRAKLLNAFRPKAKDPYPRKGISQVGLFVPSVCSAQTWVCSQHV